MESESSALGECSGTGEHTFCTLLLANIFPRTTLTKEYTYKDSMRSVFAIVSDIFNDHGLVYTGSQAELMDVPNTCLTSANKLYLPDVDAMHYAACITSHTQLSSLPSDYVTTTNADLGALMRHLETELVLVTSPQAPPGYCFVCVEKNEELHFCTHEWFSRLCNIPNESNKAADTIDWCSMDNVWCFLCDVWPESLKSIFKRSHNVWPTKEVLDICENKCKLLIVRKHHPFSRHTDIEFRFSFSLLEIVLSRSLPDAVRFVYLTVKLLYKITPLAATALKTYHLKTLLYWIASREDIGLWNDTSLKSYVLLFLDEVRSAVQQKQLKNFFVPDSNLIDHLSSEECEAILEGLGNLRNNLCDHVLKMHTSFHVSGGAEFEMQQAIVSHQSANAQFRRYGKAKEHERATLSAVTRFHYERALQCKPEIVMCIVDYGTFQWQTGDHVAAYVSWMNVLVLFDQEIHKYPVLNMTTLTFLDYCRMDAVLQSHLLDNKLWCVLLCPSDILALYSLITKHGLSPEVSEHLIERATLTATEEVYSKILEAAPLGSFYVTTILDGARYLLKWCMHFCNHGEASFAEQVRRLAEHVQSIVALLPEVQGGPPTSNEPQTAREDELDDTEDKKRERQQEWESMTKFLETYGIEGSLDVQKAAEQSKVRRKSAKYLADIVSATLRPGSPEELAYARESLLAFSQFGSDSEFVLEVLDEAFAHELEEATGVCLSELRQAGLVLAGISDLKL